MADAVVSVVQRLNTFINALQHQAHVDVAGVGGNQKSSQGGTVGFARLFLCTGVGQQWYEIESATKSCI
ncbi:hypothetical protein D3C85_1279700 [compost metagenome]